jgi:PAS domain S-box-containing protein
MKDGAARTTAGFVSLALPVLLVCVGYYAGAWVGKALRFPDSHLSLLWPPTAILLAALLLVPERRWWIYLLAVIPVHVLAQLPDGVPGWGIVSQLIGNFGQAVLAAFAVRLFNRETALFNNFRGVVVFMLGAVIFAPVLVSSIAAYLYVLSGWEQSYWYAWRARVLSNALSTLMIVPPILLVAGGMIQAIRFEPRRFLEAGSIAVGLGLIAFAALRTETAAAVFLYAPIPLLLWAAVRFGIGGLCLALLGTAYLIFLDVSGGQGPFPAHSAADNMLSLQLFLITIALPLMLLAVLIDERWSKETAVRESEARYRALVMASADMVWRADARGEVFFFTPSWHDFTGQNESTMRGLGWLEAVHPDDRERTKRVWGQALMEKRAYENELRVRARVDGSYRHFYVHAVPILAPDGGVHEWVGANIDITERKRAEQALHDLVGGTAVIGQEFFAALVRHVAAALDVDCAVVSEVDDNDSLSLKTLAIWQGNNWQDNLEYEMAQTPCGAVIREGKTVCYRENVQEVFPRDKHLADIHATTYMGTPLFNAAGRPIGNLCIIDKKRLADEQRAKSILEIFAARAAGEIERKRAEDSLRDSEERLARTESVSLVMVVHADLEGRWLKVPPTFCEMLGYSEAELRGRSFREVTHPDDFEPGWRQCQRLIQGEIKSFDLEKRYIRKDGHVVWAYLNCSLVTDSKGEPVQFLAYIRDITEHKQTEQTLRDSEMALRESEERLRLAVESSRMGVWDWDRRTGICKWSKEYFLIMGLAPFNVQPSYQAWTQCVHPDDLPLAEAAVMASIAERKVYRCEHRVVWPDGSVRWVVTRGEPSYDEAGECVRLMGVVVDVTERKQAEEEIRQLKERLEAENIYLRSEVSGAYRYGELLGGSEGIRKVLQQVNRVARTDVTVLVLGETGTGKELVARGVHGQSLRRERPLVKVNCSALPGELIESELFGHEKGAFTGATGRQVGRFELADGGTIFLDEIGDLPLKLQAKLLRVLQEGEFERLGSGKTIKVKVRVIAATNRDLLQAVQKGRFRLDLYYRLNVYPIVLPLLRERQEDIGMLAQTFLREASRRLGRLFDPISQNVLQALKTYYWPGNVRELQNVIERAAVLSQGRLLELPEEWTSMSLNESNESGVEEEVEFGKTGSREATLEDLERNHILQVLHDTQWRIEGPKGAAMILGLKASTLRSRMQKLGVKRSREAVESPTK